jgi:hypothetical protein
MLVTHAPDSPGHAGSVSETLSRCTGALGLVRPMKARLAYEPFAAALEEQVERVGKPVVAVHGAAHKLTIDYPLVRRTTGRWLGHLTRLEVPGSPDVGRGRVVVTPGAAQPFTFQPLMVSRWRSCKAAANQRDGAGDSPSSRRRTCSITSGSAPTAPRRTSQPGSRPPGFTAT